MRFVFADCVFDLDRYELRRGGAPVAVQPKVLALLQLLLEARERTVTKREILAAIWPDTVTSESSLTRAVSFARRAVGERERDARVIRTVRGRGYRIGVPVAIEERVGRAVERSRAAPRVLCREKELEIARDALDAAFAGLGQVVLFAGEPGIGKTRLATELAEDAQAQGASVFWGRCDEGEVGPAYWPWLQILRAALEEWGAEALCQSVGAAAADLADLLPELRERLPDLPRAAAADREQVRFRIFDGITRLLRARSAARPIALVLDDLHRADEPSLALVGFLAHELSGARIFVVGTYRDGQIAIGHPLQQTLAELARSQRPRSRILLRGLSEACVRRFIEALTGSAPTPRLVEGCMRRSEGNPLFLLELLQWLEARERPLEEFDSEAEREIPEGVRQVIGRRIGLLSAACREALEVASVLGREFSATSLAVVLGLEQAALFARLGEAERARIILPVRGRPGALRFSHGLVAEALYDGLETGTRVRIHARAAAELEDRVAPHPIAPTDLEIGIPASRLAELAHHFCEAGAAGDPAKAVRFAAGAGEHALRLLDFPAAIRHFELALESLSAHAPHDASRWCQIALALADARYRAGFPGECGELLWQVAERARASGDVEAQANAAVRLSQYKIGGNVLLPVHARIEVLEDSARRLHGGEIGLRARVLAALGSELYWGDDLARADSLAEEAISLARRHGDPATLWEALFARRLFRFAPDRQKMGLETGEELVELAQKSGDRGRELLARIDFRLCEPIMRADRVEIDRELERCAAIARELREPALHFLVSRANAARALWQGRLDDAETLLEETRELGRRADPDIAQLSYDTAQIPLRRMQGRFAELEATLQRDGRLPRTRGHRWSALCLLLAETRRLASARVEFEGLSARGFADLRRDSNFTCNLALLAEVCHRLGDRARAAELRELLAPWAGCYVGLHTIAAYGCASRFLGLLDCVLGDRRAAVRSLEEAVAVEERMGARPHEAWALRDLAGALEDRDGARGRAPALELRRRAREIAAEIGMAGPEFEAA
jgi:DNA-binding winged helix-turn-helix (wHTH) protein